MIDIKACGNFEFKKCLWIEDKLDTQPYKKDLKKLETQICKTTKEKCLAEWYTDFSKLDLILTAKEWNLLAYFLFGTNDIDNKNLPKTKEGKIDMSKPIKVNFWQNLVELWEKKLRKSNWVTKDFFKENILPYSTWEKKFNKTNIKWYMSEIKGSIDDIKEWLNKKWWWEKLKEIYNIPENRFQLFKKICLSINEKDIISYWMTELMPSKDWEQNIEGSRIQS